MVSNSVTPLYKVKQYIAQTLGLSADHLVEDTSTTTTRTPRSSKRCSNKKLVDSGYQFLYPTYQEGYSALLK